MEDVYDIEKIFFPIREREVFWRDMGDHHLFGVDDMKQAPEYKAIVDEERHYLFAIFKRTYNAVTNKEAYEYGKEIAHSIFTRSKDDKYFELKPFCIKMSKDRAVSVIYMEREIDIKQPVINEGWNAFLRIVNSYNGTRALNYAIGFKIYTDLYIVLPEFSVNIKIDKHKGDIKGQIYERLFQDDNIGAIDLIEKTFANKIKILKDNEIVETEFMPLFCKFMGIRKRDVSTLEKWEKHKKMAIKASDIKAKRSKKNAMFSAYDFLIVILEFMKDRAYNDIGIALIRDSDLKAGKWVDDYIGALKMKISPHEYIGNEYYDVAIQLQRNKFQL